MISTAPSDYEGGSLFVKRLPNPKVRPVVVAVGAPGLAQGPLVCAGAAVVRLPNPKVRPVVVAVGAPGLAQGPLACPGAAVAKGFAAAVGGTWASAVPV
jgi:hypothetical protein